MLAVDSHLTRTRSACAGMQQLRFLPMSMVSDDGLPSPCILRKHSKRYVNIPNLTNTNGHRILNSGEGMNLKQIADFVKIKHTLFSLPFVLIGYFIAVEEFNHGYGIDLLWILLAAVGARGLAMTLNRIIDRDIDAANPRTQGRHLASGAMSIQTAWILSAVFLVVLLVSAGLLNEVALMMAWLPVLAFVIYPYMKRYTPGCVIFGSASAWDSPPLAHGLLSLQIHTGGPRLLMHHYGLQPSLRFHSVLHSGLQPLTSTMHEWMLRAIVNKAFTHSHRSLVSEQQREQRYNSHCCGSPVSPFLIRWKEFGSLPLRV